MFTLGFSLSGFSPPSRAFLFNKALVIKRRSIARLLVNNKAFEQMLICAAIAKRIILVLNG